MILAGKQEEKKDFGNLNPLAHISEHIWESGRPDSQERWIEDFKPYYDLIGIYRIDNTHAMYRFQKNEALSGELKPKAYMFENVIINHTKQYDIKQADK